MGRVVQSGFVFFRVILCAILVEAHGCSGSVLACNLALVGDVSSPRANHAFSGRIAKRRTANRCWFLRRVMERGLRDRRSFDVSRMLHEGVFTKTRMSRAE